jgi:hypothetical protein
MSSNFNIRSVVKEFLREKVEVEELPKQMLSAASVDTQIDDFLIDAEKKANKVAKSEDDMSLERVDRLIGLGSLNEKENSEEEVLETPSIDVATFAADIARLSKNYDNLLDIPSTIVNRAIGYLLVNYDEATVEEFKQVLTGNFNVQLTMAGETYDEPEAPLAGRGMSSTGGGV